MLKAVVKRDTDAQLCVSFSYELLLHGIRRVIVRPTTLEGAFLLEPESLPDERGFFARIWCRDELGALGLVTDIAQCNVAYNEHKATLRGLHFQRPPHEEVKIVRCTAGAVYDVAVDLRPSSPTYLAWIGVELSAANRLGLYIPAGCAHGYQTLVDRTEAFYLHSTEYASGFADGVRWDDPAFGIEWPQADDRIMSDKDRQWPDYAAATAFS